MKEKSNKKRLGLFGGGGDMPSQVGEINALEEEIAALNDEDLKKEGIKLKERAQTEDLDKLLVRAFAVVRETSKRMLNMRHFDVQLWGGISMHNRGIAEMKTGEGKTLAATLPVYLNALSGDGVHVITVNDYLAKRDAVWMGQIYHFLGLTVSCLIHDEALMYDPEWKLSEEEKDSADKERDEVGSYKIKEEYLRPVTRAEAYNADITHGTNHQFGFDYLRDNIRADKREQVQRKLNFALIDEVDSILIDEARTPLIISAPDTNSSENYKVFSRAVQNLTPEEDYIVDEKLKSIEITESGIDKIEKITNTKNLYAVENLQLVHYLEASLRAKALFNKDKEYVVKDGEVIIVDQFTGRLMFGRRYSAGLHQAIEAKENVNVKEESKTMAQITIQNYFRLYNKVSGMTGTAKTSEEEFNKVYGMGVYSIPTNRPLARDDMPDLIYRTVDAKYKAIARDVKKAHEKGQPVLLGTVSIEHNELLSSYLKKANIPHEMLNAKNNEREGSIVAQAGRAHAVTVATNMAGRGVDIVLGGAPLNEEEYEKVKALGGLHVIGTERHEARRIDDQLRGRAGRQGDPGSSQFYLSLEDNLMRVFGGEKLQGLMEKFNFPEDQPIENKMVTKAISQAQTRVEGFNFDARAHLLEYDDILNKQRLATYIKRQEIVEAASFERIKDGDEEKLKIKDKEKIREILRESVDASLAQVKGANLSEEELKKLFAEIGITGDESDIKNIEKITTEKIANLSDEFLGVIGRILLEITNMLWMNHLEDVEALIESVRLRAYGQRDPLVEYRKEGRMFFDRMQEHFDEWVFRNIFKLQVTRDDAHQHSHKKPVNNDPKFKKVGRNDLCPCGSGKKFKKCHGA